MIKIGTIFNCERCGADMEYGGANIFECESKDGSTYDYCVDCFEKHTTSTEEVANLIIS